MLNHFREPQKAVLSIQQDLDDTGPKAALFIDMAKLYFIDCEVWEGREELVACVVLCEDGLPAGLCFWWAFLPEASCINHCLVEVLYCVASLASGSVDGSVVSALCCLKFAHSLPKVCSAGSVIGYVGGVLWGQSVRDCLCIK